MKLPYHLEEQNRLAKSLLYPIMYEDKENNAKLIYTEELKNVMKDLDEDKKEILENYIKRKNIVIVDSSLTMEEQSEFIKKFIKENEDKTLEDYKHDKNDGSINVTPVDIAYYLSGNIKNEVNMAMQFEMPYLLEKLDINDDVTRIMVVLDVIMNGKSKILRPIRIDDKVRNSHIMGAPLKNIAAYYKCDVLGPINEEIEMERYIKKLEEIVKASSSVSDEQAMDYLLGTISAFKK